MTEYDTDQYTEPQQGLEPHTNAEVLSPDVTPNEDNPFAKRQAVIDQIAKWIDPNVIAKAITEELVDLEIEVTLETCQKVWLRVLQVIHEQVSQAIRYNHMA